MILKTDEVGGLIYIVWFGGDSEGSTVHTCTYVLILRIVSVTSGLSSGKCYANNVKACKSIRG